MKRQIVNIVNFVRAIEPRWEIDLVEATREQINIMKEYGLRGTFLLQYDALLLPVYREMMKELDSGQFELGVWFETVQEQVEAAGLEWTGRFPWDWHVHCGFSLGYTKEQREKLADIQFEKFKEVFGYYPRVFGSWLFDTHTVAYLSEKYGLDAVCNCKEQYGTDGYTLWGGYYGQAYYPSKNNIFMPSQTKENQINTPLFRMLGSDPVYQYDFGLDPEAGAKAFQGVITLEPVYTGQGGGDPKWVDWFMKENYSGDCLTFGYAQAGQENAFGWSGMKNGYTYQIPLFAKLQQEGRITVEPLGETGRWFKKEYAETPASAITAHTAYDDEKKNSVWYCTKNYRVNLYCDNGIQRIRDLHVFSDAFRDPFDDTVCTENFAVYETLPVADGNRYSGNGIIAGIYPFRGGNPITGSKMSFRDCGDGSAEISYGDLTYLLSDDRLKISSSADFTLKNKIGKDGNHLPSVISLEEKNILLEYSGVKYGIKLLSGTFTDKYTINSENSIIEAVILNK